MEWLHPQQAEGAGSPRKERRIYGAGGLDPITGSWIPSCVWSALTRRAEKGWIYLGGAWIPLWGADFFGIGLASLAVGAGSIWGRTGSLCGGMDPLEGQLRGQGWGQVGLGGLC